MSQVGCRPYWLPSTLFLSTEADNCTKASQLDQFLGLMAKVEEIPNEKALFEEYKCLRPCRFMEYKVRYFYRSVRSLQNKEKTPF